MINDDVQVSLHSSGGYQVWSKLGTDPELVTYCKIIYDAFMAALKEANITDMCVLVRPNGIVCKSILNCETCYDHSYWVKAPIHRWVFWLTSNNLKLITPVGHDTPIDLADPQGITKLSDLILRIHRSEDFGSNIPQWSKSS